MRVLIGTRIVEIQLLITVSAEQQEKRKVPGHIRTQSPYKIQGVETDTKTGLRMNPFNAGSGRLKHYGANDLQTDMVVCFHVFGLYPSC